jgi:hypothetical protein
LAAVLDLEVTSSARSSLSQRRGEGAHRPDLARESLWGSERIRGELLKLGIVVSNRSIRRYRWRKPRPVGSQRWRTFLSNQLRGIWAADLFVDQTLTFRTLYVFFFIRHQRRELLDFNVTASPTAAWIWQQLLEATPWSRQPKFLIHDRDAVYGGTLTVSWRVWASQGCGPRPGRQMPTPWASESCGRSGPNVSIT